MKMKSIITIGLFGALCITARGMEEELTFEGCTFGSKKDATSKFFSPNQTRNNQENDDCSYMSWRKKTYLRLSGSFPIPIKRNNKKEGVPNKQHFLARSLPSRFYDKKSQEKPPTSGHTKEITESRVQSKSAPTQIIGLHLLFSTIVLRRRSSNLRGIPKINWPRRKQNKL